MAKEGDAVVPKKRKPESAETSNGGSEVKQPKTNVDEKKSNSAGIYQRVTAFEEKEALTRDSTTDLEQYRLLCKEFSDHICKISDLMTTKPDGWAEEVKERRIEVGLLTVYMKKLNRVEKIRNKNSRENVTKKRQQVDVSQLQLQNLMCEIQHLSREVDKCLCFKSKPLGVDLVPVEEFFAEAPETISRPETTKSDDHQLLLARLEWELFQRKELSILCSKLDEKKKSLSSQINKKQCDLDGLAPLIKEVLTVTKPLQDKLGYTACSALKSDKASFLPHCLYFLYIQASAYRDASDENIAIEINGNEDLAREVMKQQTYSGNKESISSGDESDCVEVERAPKREVFDKFEKKRERLLEKHPLTVTIKLTFKDESYLSLEFCYLLKLNIMTVMPSLNLANSQLKGSEAGECLQNRNVLSQLYAGDDGTESPNVSNHYQLNEVGLASLDTQKLGFPYVWVQKIGGLDFTSAIDGTVEPKMETSKASIPDVIKVIKRRVRCRIALIKQIISLENKNVIGPPAMKSVKLTSSIKSWKSISWEEFREHPASAHLDEASVSPHDMVYHALIVRGKVKLIVLTVVKCDYPMVPPIYALQIEWNDKVLNGSNSDRVVDMEREVNVYWKELTEDPTWSATLILYQVHRLITMFDIFLECNDASRFSAEKKTFLHPHKGRRRQHPYKYIQMGEGIFVQR
uniref:THO complex subunit 5 n=2 Tax=Lygus hesperus TaxID=30085 RepID=A0A0A9Z9M7_LYGHE